MATFRFATVDDTDAIMRFLHDHWRAGHILSRSKPLFLHDFHVNGRLNVGLAVNDADEVIGMLGYFICNGSPEPDMTGSIWKVLEEENTTDSKGAFLGVYLRKFILDNVPHRHFATPGPGPQTRNIYRMLRMTWHRMRHFYRVNPDVEAFQIAVFPEGVPTPPPAPEIGAGTLTLCRHVDDLRDFDFEGQTHIAPRKDLAYLDHRYLQHPIYDYLPYAWREDGELKNIVMCRRAEAQGRHCLRVVDFLGDESNLPRIAPHLFQVIRDADDEYIDFICHGMSAEIMRAAGFDELDLDQQELIIPNYFEPYTAMNVGINCVADRTRTLHVRLCRADGDMDRPNRLPSDVP